MSSKHCSKWASKARPSEQNEAKVGDSYAEKKNHLVAASGRLSSVVANLCVEGKLALASTSSQLFSINALSRGDGIWRKGTTNFHAVT